MVENLLNIALVICLMGLSFCAGALSQLNFTNSIFSDWRETIKKWEEDRKYWQDSMEVLKK